MENYLLFDENHDFNLNDTFFQVFFGTDANIFRLFIPNAAPDETGSITVNEIQMLDDDRNPTAQIGLFGSLILNIFSTTTINANLP
jgi:hypothetical protein